MNSTELAQLNAIISAIEALQAQMEEAIAAATASVPNSQAALAIQIQMNRLIFPLNALKSALNN